MEKGREWEILGKGVELLAMLSVRKARFHLETKGVAAEGEKGRLRVKNAWYAMVGGWEMWAVGSGWLVCRRRPAVVVAFGVSF